MPSPPLVAHVVRHYGGVTEPFIAQRVLSTTEPVELWYERVEGELPAVASVNVHSPWMPPASSRDRLFHHIPVIGRSQAGAYAKAELARRPDVLHAHYLTTGYLVGLKTHTPLVVSTYGFDVSVIPRHPLWANAIGRLARRAAVVLAEGPFMRDRIVALGIPMDRVRIVPISAGQDAARWRLPAPRGPLRIASCGRLVKKKGHDIALHAFAQAVNELPEGSSLVIIGDGPERGELSRLARDLNLGTKVRFAGALPRDRYMAELDGADLLVAASRTAPNGDAEGGAPTTILDAQAVGVVVVGSDHCDIPFLVADGETGFLCREGDPQSLADAILRSVRARSSWGRIASAARRQLERRHSAAQLAHSINAIHAEAAAIEEAANPHYESFDNLK